MEWRGYLTPQEIIELVDDHQCEPSDRSKTILRRCRDLLAQGITSAWWFYFVPPLELGLRDEQNGDFSSYW